MSGYNWVGAARVAAVASSDSNTTIVSANKSRKGLYLYNSDANAAYVKFGATATSSDFTVKIAADGFWEMPTNPVYTGRIDAIWAANGSGSMHVTEL